MSLGGPVETTVHSIYSYCQSKQYTQEHGALGKGAIWAKVFTKTFKTFQNIPVKYFITLEAIHTCTSQQISAQNGATRV